MYEDTYLGTADSSVQLVQDIGLANVGLNPDIGNLIRLHRPIEDWREMVAKTLPYSNYWHMKNYIRDEDVARDSYVAMPAPMESGLINYREAFKVALSVGFQGILCTEHYGGDGLSVTASNQDYLRRQVLPKTDGYALGQSQVAQGRQQPAPRNSPASDPRLTGPTLAPGAAVKSFGGGRTTGSTSASSTALVLQHGFNEETMTQIFDNPADFADEALDGFVAANRGYVARVDGGVVRSTEIPAGQVALVVGGGSGHYPAFAGLVGPGLAAGLGLRQHVRVARRRPGLPRGQGRQRRRRRAAELRQLRR